MMAFWPQQTKNYMFNIRLNKFGNNKLFDRFLYEKGSKLLRLILAFATINILFLVIFEIQMYI